MKREKRRRHPEIVNHQSWSTRLLPRGLVVVDLRNCTVMGGFSHYSPFVFQLALTPSFPGEPDRRVPPDIQKLFSVPCVEISLSASHNPSKMLCLFSDTRNIAISSTTFVPITLVFQGSCSDSFRPYGSNRKMRPCSSIVGLVNDV